VSDRRPTGGSEGRKQGLPSGEKAVILPILVGSSGHILTMKYDKLHVTVSQEA
jgi:hypothetical protein